MTVLRYYDRVAATWDRLYQQFAPRVAAAATDHAYYLELMRFYAHLHDGHSGVFWPAAFDEALGYPPLEIRPVNGRAVIVRLLRQTDELTTLGIRPGLAINRVDDRPVGELVDYWRALKTGSTPQATDRLAYFRVLTGPRQSTVTVTVETPDGAARQVRLTRSEKYFNDTNLDPPLAHVARHLDGGLGYFQANQMRPEVSEAFARFIEDAADLKGLIVDVRYNGGGSDQVSFEMVRRLIDRQAAGPIYEVTSYRADRRALREPQEVIRTQPTLAPADRPAVHRQADRAHRHAIAQCDRERIPVGDPPAARHHLHRRTHCRVDRPAAGVSAARRGARRGVQPAVVLARRSEFVGIGFKPDVAAHLTAADLFTDRDSTLATAITLLR